MSHECNFTFQWVVVCFCMDHTEGSYTVICFPEPKPKTGLGQKALGFAVSGWGSSYVTPDVNSVDKSNDCARHPGITTTTPQPFYGPFSRTTQVSRCQKENFWTLWCKGRLTEADTDQPAGRHSIRSNWCPPPPFPILYRPDALPAAQPTVPKHWRQPRHPGIT